MDGAGATLWATVRSYFTCGEKEAKSLGFPRCYKETPSGIFIGFPDETVRKNCLSQVFQSFIEIGPLVANGPELPSIWIVGAVAQRRHQPFVDRAVSSGSEGPQSRAKPLLAAPALFRVA